MANPGNLKPFGPDNPPPGKGRPKGTRNVSTVLREMMEKIAPGEIVDAKFVKEFCKGKKRVTNADALAARLLSEGIVKGESWAIKELIDRTEGKATERHEITGDLELHVVAAPLKMDEDAWKSKAEQLPEQRVRQLKAG